MMSLACFMVTAGMLDWCLADSAAILRFWLERRAAVWSRGLGSGDTGIMGG